MEWVKSVRDTLSACWRVEEREMLLWALICPALNVVRMENLMVRYSRLDESITKLLALRLTTTDHQWAKDLSI